MACEDMDFLYLSHIPEADRRIVTGGSQITAVRREGKRVHHIRVPLEQATDFPVLEVVDADGITILGFLVSGQKSSHRQIPCIPGRALRQRSCQPGHLLSGLGWSVPSRLSARPRLAPPG